MEIIMCQQQNMVFSFLLQKVASVMIKVIQIYEKIKYIQTTF